MKRAIYTRFLEATSIALNFCVKHRWWAVAKSLIEFRKANIARNLRITTVTTKYL